MIFARAKRLTARYLRCNGRAATGSPETGMKMGTDNTRLPLQLYAVSHRPYAIGSAASEKAADRR